MIYISSHLVNIAIDLSDFCGALSLAVIEYFDWEKIFSNVNTVCLY